MLYVNAYESPIGTLTLASDGEGLNGLWMQGQKYHGASLSEDIEQAERADDAIIAAARAWLDAYFAGKRPAIDEVPLRPIGSDFRQIVWRLLAQIPYGETTTYGELAQQVAREQRRQRTAAMAVGGAVGHNPIGIIVPCHRVVGADGSLTSYAGGLDKKIWLLEHEGVDMTRLYRPTKGTAL